MGDVKAAFDEWAATNDIDDLHALDIFARGWHAHAAKQDAAGQKLADACRGVLLGRWTQRRKNLINDLAAWDAAQEGGK